MPVRGSTKMVRGSVICGDGTQTKTVRYCAAQWRPISSTRKLQKVMGSLSPGQIALLIIAGLAAAGVVISLIRTRRTFAGYGEIEDQVRRLSQTMGGEVFRDGSDVVVSGTYYG